MVVRLLGRCVRTVRTRLVGGQVVPQSADPAAEQDANLEPGNRSPREDGRVGPQCVEPRRPQSVGDPSGDSKVPSSSKRGAIARRRGVLANHPVGPLQCAWQLMLQCVAPRCHHFLRAGGAAGGPATARSGTDDRKFADEDVGRGHPIGDTYGASGLLGVMGRRIAHA